MGSTVFQPDAQDHHERELAPWSLMPPSDSNRRLNVYATSLMWSVKDSVRAKPILNRGRVPR